MRCVISGIRFKTKRDRSGMRHQNVGSGVVPIAILANDLSSKAKVRNAGVNDGVRSKVGFFHLLKICTKRGVVQEFLAAHKHFFLLSFRMPRVSITGRKL